MSGSGAALLASAAGFGPVHHIGLVARDLERLRRFYTDIMGFRQNAAFPEHGIAFLEAGGLQIELLKDDREAQSRSGSGWQHLAWSVSNVDAAFTLLVERGAQAHSAPESFPAEAPVYRIAFLRDPDGNLLELIQRLDDQTV